MDLLVEEKNSVSLRRIFTKDGDHYLLVKGSLPGDLEILIFDGKTSWCGTVTKEMLQAVARSLEMDEDLYMQLSTDVLQPQRDTMEQNISFEVKHDSGKVKLMWKQEMENGMKVQLGDVLLEKDATHNFPASTMLDVAVDQFSLLQNRIKRLQDANNQLLEERERSLKRLEDCVVFKETLEETMYRKFAIVLNDKKAKIRELKQEVLELQKKEKTATDENKAQEDSAEDGENTDEEKEREKEKRSAALKRDDSSLGVRQTYLLATKDDEEVEVPAVKRKRGSRLQKVSASTAIPRTTSLPRPQKQDSLSPPLRTASQTKSNPSDEQLDADHLMDLI